MKRMSRMNGTLTAAMALALTAGAASAQCRAHQSKGEQPNGGQLTGSFASPLEARSMTDAMTETLGGGSFADLQPEAKQSVTRHKVYVKVVGPDGEVREWTFDGEDGPHAIHMHGQDGGHEGGSKASPDGKTKFFRVRPGDFDFDFDWETDWDFEGLEDLKALDAEEIEKKVRSHVEKMHQHFQHGMRVFGGENFAFDVEGVPSAEEIEKLVEKAMESVELRWEGGEAFGFDGGEFDFDVEGMHEHLRHLDERLHEMKKRLHEHLHEGGQEDASPRRHRGRAAPVVLGWAPVGQPEAITLRKRGGQPDNTTYNVVIKKQDGGESYVVEIDDGKATAKVNGKKVPAERVKLGGGKVVILGEDGEEMASFPVMISPGTTGAWSTTSPGGTLSQDGPSVFQFDADAFEGAGSFSFAGPPPVMLGITMASPGESVAQHFDLEEGEGIEIQSVIEGLPAAEAGLKAKDIIVEVKGAEKATPEALRVVLREKQPGDEITVKVLRQGEVEERVIELREYDAEKLGSLVEVSPEMGRFWHGQGGQHFGGQQFSPQFWGEFEKSLKGSLQQHMSEHQIDEAKRAFEEAMKHMRTATGQGLRITPQEDGQWLYLQGEDGQERQFFAVPRGRGGDDLDKQIAGLKEELAEVRRQRDEMAGELREIKALLKKLADDRQ